MPKDNAPRVLVVDDEESLREVMTILLRTQLGCEVDRASSGEEAIAKLDAGERYSMVVTDLRMEGLTGLDVLKRVKELDQACQVILITAHGTVETALSAIRDGAYDFMEKPWKRDHILPVLRRALEKYELVRENVYLRKALKEEKRGMSQIIGDSEPMRRIYGLIERVAPRPTTILVTGESGTGKELVARAIHEHSQVSSGPFIAVNCGAIPENLIESELFGHKKGAFTGADRDKTGLFEAAENGTLFLDELGELPLNTQVRLLRALQEHMIRPVGATSERSVNCRIVAATNRNLFEEVQQGTFREDLYYRLNVINIELPPLRERGNDIRLLLQHYIKDYADRMHSPVEGVHADAMKILLSYSYPGNIRELQNIIERAVTLEQGELITVDVLPYHLQSETFERVTEEIEIPEEGIELELMVERLERTLLTKALERSNGVKTEAARLLGVSFRSLRYRLDKYNIE